MCRECYLKIDKIAPNKGKKGGTNTGRTHFKKGMVPWNKGIKRSADDCKKQSERLKGRPMPKPEGFSETMRKVNPPVGEKVKYRHGLCKENKVWRGGYVFLYRPDHPSSRNVPPDYGYIAEHRMIIENQLGRQLTKNEPIHHIDGRKDNNDPENLLYCETRKEHNYVHKKMEIFVEKLIREGKVYYDRDRKDFFFR